MHFWKYNLSPLMDLQFHIYDFSFDKSLSDLEEAAARKRHKRTNERKKGITFHLETNILYLLYAGRKDLKWSLIPGSNTGGGEPSFSCSFKLQCSSGFKPSAYEDPNMVTKCLGSKHNYIKFSLLLLLSIENAICAQSIVYPKKKCQLKLITTTRYPSTSSRISTRAPKRFCYLMVKYNLCT